MNLWSWYSSKLELINLAGKEGNVKLLWELSDKAAVLGDSLWIWGLHLCRTSAQLLALARSLVLAVLHFPVCEMGWQWVLAAVRCREDEERSSGEHLVPHWLSTCSGKCSTQETQWGIKHESLPTTAGKSGEGHQTDFNPGHSAKALSHCQDNQKQGKLGRLSQPRWTKGNIRIKSLESWGFLGSPVGLVRTLCFHCWGPGFDPWLAN